ncbi:glycoside hydrolase superfamily [Pyronema domesticum]|nr:glycoside hydrolase superfamily [Pyronema domesticum]
MLWKTVLIFLASSSLVTAQFNKVTAAEAWKAMQPGWNIGNTMDGVPDETSWGNPLITTQLLDAIRATGMKSVRIPITWTDHFISQAPDYTVNATWMARVEQVVDWALDRGFWVDINVHHDSWQWANLSDDTDLDAKFAKLEKLWTQIADRFKNKSEKLIFEPLNEPQGSTQVHADRYNDLNQRVVNIVRASGGYNKDRLMTLPGLNTNIANTVNWFKVPTNADPWILHVHDYDPWDFVSTSWGRTFWGTDADKKVIEDTFVNLQSRFNAPALIGEWGTTGKSVERGAAWIYFDNFIRTSRSYNLTAQLWDNGEHFNRISLKWNDPVKRDLIISAASGIVNTLPAYDQTATIYQKINQTVTAKNINLVLNGNTITAITNTAGKTLKKGTDYTITSSGVTISAAYLSTVLKGTIGLKDTIKIKSNRGVSLPFDLVLYSTPTVSSSSITITDSSSDYTIPVNVGGSTLATVKAVKADGTYLKDDWTSSLGTLQQGRINWGDFDTTSDGKGVILKAALLATMKGVGKVTLTLEYWPRTEGNNVTVGVTVN